MVMSCSPSKLGSDVFTSMMILSRFSINHLVENDSASTHLVSHLDELRGSAHTGTRHNASIFLDVCCLYDYDVQVFVGAIFCVESLLGLVSCRASAAVYYRTYVDEVHREHGQVLIEEVDATLIDTLGNGLSDLVGTSTIDHVQARPAVLRLRARRCSDEE